MEALIAVAQTYGPWLVLGGGLLFLLRRSGGGGLGGCCGAPQNGSAGGASCHQPAAPLQIDRADAPPVPTTVNMLQARLDALRAQQEALAQQITALEAEDPSLRPRATAGNRGSAR